jgi:uncharacterized protein (DUF427 family)
MRATWRGTGIAGSEDTTVVDGHTYFPVDAVDRQYLRSSGRRTACPWKGTASYFDVVVGDHVNGGAAWTYPQPSDRAGPLVGGRIGFWRGVKIARGDGEQHRSRLARLLGRR